MFIKEVMSKVQIPEKLLFKLGSEMKMDAHWIDVKLQSGAVFPKMVVRGGRYITGQANDANGIGEVSFTTEQIVNIRRQAFFSWWPFW